MMGAALMASKACYRSGCGLVTLMHFEQQSLTGKIPELVLFPFKKEEASAQIDLLVSTANRNSACLIGPGLGQDKETKNILNKLMQQLESSTVLDADALNLFAQAPYPLPEKVIMTPHLGELGRLLNLAERPLVTEKLINAVKGFCKKKNKVVVIVKGAPTFIVSPNDETAVYVGGSKGMAKGGSGDVLAGIICSLLSQGLSCYEASCLGVYLHGEAGKLASQEKTDYALMPTDLIESLPEIFKQLSYKE